MSYEQITTMWRVIAVVAGITAILAGFLAQDYAKKADAQKSQLQRAKETATGMLEAAPEKRPPPFPHPQVEFGDSGAVLVWAGVEGQPMLKFAEDSNLVVGLDQAQRIQVSIAVRDKTGSVSAEIIRNEWKVRPSLIWDRNYNENTFEVRGGSGDIVLQVRLEGRRVQLQMKLYDTHGNGFAFGKGTGPDGKVGGVIERTGPDRPELRIRIEPLFVYPSNSHLGELKKT